jgi:hypothetical protein
MTTVLTILGYALLLVAWSALPLLLAWGWVTKKNRDEQYRSERIAALREHIDEAFHKNMEEAKSDEDLLRLWSDYQWDKGAPERWSREMRGLPVSYEGAPTSCRVTRVLPDDKGCDRRHETTNQQHG